MPHRLLDLDTIDAERTRAYRQQNLRGLPHCGVEQAQQPADEQPQTLRTSGGERIKLLNGCELGDHGPWLNRLVDIPNTSANGR
jgi:hypothetical protein